MKYIGTTKKGYPVHSYTFVEWQLVKEKPKAGIILAKRKVCHTNQKESSR